MKIIYKYQLAITPLQKINIPKGAEILSFQIQDRIPCVWVLLDTEETPIEREFQIYGTGINISEHEKRQYIGTCQIDNFVFHCFELLKHKDND